ncbi:hypothetical protein B0T25DRAFT_561212 [Lasiosphaeria hispida]|uniref:Uncharacterized protein n=1 Tax=Lasiosphaeria hispida TaxID=260671 RepID=A0AAJ0M7E4_9PEZI|nr:hypothetical protein B0T25DRAFT_561219 [Lasiosphaeria hispida]KAK3338645.1 hypothetical protein B0T25DRAFT_561212 [Lasiosphaeria hispida]
MAWRFLKDPGPDCTSSNDDIDKKAPPRLLRRAPVPHGLPPRISCLKPTDPAPASPTVPPDFALGPNRPFGYPHLLDTSNISSNTNLRSFRLCDAVATFFWKYNKRFCPHFFDYVSPMASLAVTDRRTHRGDDRNPAITWYIYRGDDHGTVSTPFPSPWRSDRPSLAPATNVPPEMQANPDEPNVSPPPIPIQVEYYPNGSQTRSWGYAGVQTAVGEWMATHVKGWDDKEWRMLGQEEMELYGSYIGREMMLKALYNPTPYLDYFLMVAHQQVHYEWPKRDRGNGMRGLSLSLKTSTDLANMGAGHYQNCKAEPASFDAPTAEQLEGGDRPLSLLRPGTWTREPQKKRPVITINDYMDFGP